MAKVLKENGVTVIGIDINRLAENMDDFIAVDISELASIKTTVSAFPDGIDAQCSTAGLHPTRDRGLVIKINFLGLRYLTELMIS